MKRFNAKSLLALALTVCVAVVSLPLATLAGGGAAEAYTEPSIALTEGSETENISTALAGAADNSIVDVDGDGKLDYVSLGASNVNGYGLQGYLPADIDLNNYADANVYGYRRDEVTGSYPALLKDYYINQGIDVEWHQLGISSMRAEELRVLLDDGFTGDRYTEWRFTGDDDNWFIKATGSLEATKNDYRTSIANADLITLDIGVNNFGVYLANEITNPGWKGHDVSSLDTEYKAYYIYLREWILEKAPELAGYQDMLDTVAYAYLGFISSFDVSVAKIRELNPDATIVVVPIQNIIPDLKVVMEGTVIDVGALVSELTNAANIYTAHLSPYHNEYLYASTVRENDKARVEFYIDLIKEYNGDLDVYGEDKINIIDCFNLYDNSLHIVFRVQYMFAEVYKDELSAIGMTAEQFVAAGARGDFDNNPQLLPYYEGYLNTLNTAYDACAQMMKIAATYDTIDISEYTNAAGNAVMNKVTDIITAAVVNGTPVPENLSEYIAAETGVSVAAAETILGFGVRAEIGNSFFGHPSLGGHKELADAVISAIENKTTGISFAADYAGGLMEKIVAIYKLADEAGLVEEAKKDASEAVKEFITEKKDSLLENITNGADGAVDLITSGKDGIMDGVTSAIDKAKDIAKDILDKISGAVNKD